MGRVAEDTIDETAARVRMMGRGQGVSGVWVPVEGGRQAEEKYHTW